MNPVLLHEIPTPVIVGVAVVLWVAIPAVAYYVTGVWAKASGGLSPEEVRAWAAPPAETLSGDADA